MIHITFDKNLYTKYALETTAAAFFDLCTFSLVEEKTAYQVTLEEKEPLNLLKEEFCNYALGIVKESLPCSK